MVGSTTKLSNREIRGYRPFKRLREHPVYKAFVEAVRNGENDARYPLADWLAENGMSFKSALIWAMNF